MQDRSAAYSVPFSFRELSFEEASVLAADTGKISGKAVPKLETVVDMLGELGRPDGHFDCIQVAGTNGKTSTTRFTAALLNAEGLRAGLYTSPQLVRYPERIEIGGSVISDGDFARGVSAAIEAGRRVNARRSAKGEEPYAFSPFDLLTVAAMVVFAEAAVDVAVLEAGLGGRWDATSATEPSVVGITGIGLDHMHILGNTLEEIAAEKAAIIKPGRKVVLGAGTRGVGVRKVIADRCDACGVAPIEPSFAVRKAPQGLGDTVDFSCATPCAQYDLAIRKPSYQPQNAACAIALAEAYLGRALDPLKAQRALDACPIPGRFDIVRTDPLLLVDACHNPQSCENFVAALDAVEPDPSRRPTLLVAALTDKDVAGIIDVLVPAFPRVAVTQTGSDRAMSADDLAQLVQVELAAQERPADHLAGVFTSVGQAFDALTRAGESLVAAGTITLAGEVIGLFR